MLVPIELQAVPLSLRFTALLLASLKKIRLPNEPWVASKGLDLSPSSFEPEASAQEGRLFQSRKLPLSLIAKGGFMAKKQEKVDGKSSDESEDFLQVIPPEIPAMLDNVLMVFSKNIPDDAKSKCALNDGTEYPEEGDETAKKRHLVNFVRDRLEIIARLEYTLWLNGRLPFITPRELFIWRLRQYVEYVWAFQLPDDDDLGMIFNSTRLRAAQLTSDFTARFRKALLFPIALRRLYRILRNEDEQNVMVDKEIEYRKAFGPTFKVPSNRYVQDTNSLIEEYRLRERGFLRDAGLVSKEENIMWVSHQVIDLAKDDDMRNELFELYKIPREGGYLG